CSAGESSLKSALPSSGPSDRARLRATALRTVDASPDNATGSRRLAPAYASLRLASTDAKVTSGRRVRKKSIAFQASSESRASSGVRVADRKTGCATSTKNSWTPAGVAFRVQGAPLGNMGSPDAAWNARISQRRPDA